MSKTCMSAQHIYSVNLARSTGTPFLHFDFATGSSPQSQGWGSQKNVTWRKGGVQKFKISFWKQCMALGCHLWACAFFRVWIWCHGRYCEWSFSGICLCMKRKSSVFLGYPVLLLPSKAQQRILFVSVFERTSPSTILDSCRFVCRDPLECVWHYG